MSLNSNFGLRRVKKMVFPNPKQQRGISLERVESLGVFRCPNCTEVEKENERLRERIKQLEDLLNLYKDVENE